MKSIGKRNEDETDKAVSIKETRKMSGLNTKKKIHHHNMHAKLAKSL